MNNILTPSNNLFNDLPYGEIENLENLFSHQFHIKKFDREKLFFCLNFQFLPLKLNKRMKNLIY